MSITHQFEFGFEVVQLLDALLVVLQLDPDGLQFLGGKIGCLSQFPET